jgi:Zn-finger nucleic acid-binding protein
MGAAYPKADLGTLPACRPFTGYDDRGETMNCPTDGAVLVMSERNGIEIDYCPTCRGVWLDRGELDKIIDRSMNQPVPEYAVPPQRDQRQPQAHGYRKPKRKESWLSELFD